MTTGPGHNGGPPLPEYEERERPGNWFAVSRDIFDHPIVGIHDRAFTDTEAWLYMLSIASFAQTEVVNKGSIIVLDPGQLMAAHAYLAKRWKWSPDKVRWYLKRLGDEAMITRYTTDSRGQTIGSENGKINTNQPTNQNTNHHPNQNTKRNTNQIQIITICNYAIYQYVQQQLHQAKPQPSPQPSHQPQHQASSQESNTSNTKTPSNLESESSSLCAPSAKAEVPRDEPVCLEYPADHGVLVNGKTIRHESGAFAISLPAVHIAAKPSKWSEEDINARCLTRALDWGKRLSEGMPAHLVIPSDIVLSLSGEIVHDAETAKAEAKAERAARKGTALPADWVLPKSWGEWAYRKYDVSPDRIRREAARFKDYWLSTARNPTKKNWEAAWRVWCSSDKLGWRERGSYRPEAHELPLVADLVDPDAAAYQADLAKARAMTWNDADDH